LYAIVAVGSVAISMTRSAFWQPEHSAAPIAAVALMGLVVALLYRRGWAWVVLLLVETLAAASILADYDGWPEALVSALGLVLLLSPQMRAYIRPSLRGARRSQR
jgi:hypothetical protein